MGIAFSSPAWEARSRSVLITGASSGIGAETARQFAKEGANLALVARGKENLETVAKECRQLGAETVKIYMIDLSNNNAIKTGMEKAIADFQGFDVVVLNAGRSHGCYFEEIKDTSQIEYMVNLNVTGVIISLHSLLPSIYKSRHSRIVVISSTAGIIGVPYRTIYCATKHALTGFCNSFRIELNATYEKEAPAVCLINFPGVSGTKLNSDRMDFGTEQPPAQFDASAGMPLPEAVEGLMSAIAAGKREWGQPFKVTFLRPLYSLIPGILDGFILKRVRRLRIDKK